MSKTPLVLGEERGKALGGAQRPYIQCWRSKEHMAVEFRFVRAQKVTRKNVFAEANGHFQRVPHEDRGKCMALPKQYVEHINSGGIRYLSSESIVECFSFAWANCAKNFTLFSSSWSIASVDCARHRIVGITRYHGSALQQPLGFFFHPLPGGGGGLCFSRSPLTISF